MHLHCAVLRINIIVSLKIAKIFALNATSSHIHLFQAQRYHTVIQPSILSQCQVVYMFAYISAATSS